MGIFSNILIDIEDNKQYGTAFGEEEVDNAIREFLDAQDQAYNDDMDGDHASALASAGFGTDEDYGYYGE
jgi:hypothetical protein